MYTTTHLSPTHGTMWEGEQGGADRRSCKVEGLALTGATLYSSLIFLSLSHPYAFPKGDAGPRSDGPLTGMGRTPQDNLSAQSQRHTGDERNQSVGA